MGSIRTEAAGELRVSAPGLDKRNDKSHSFELTLLKVTNAIVCVAMAKGKSFRTASERQCYPELWNKRQRVTTQNRCAGIGARATAETQIEIIKVDREIVLLSLHEMVQVRLVQKFVPIERVEQRSKENKHSSETRPNTTRFW